MKSKPKYKVGDYILVLRSQNPYLICKIKKLYSYILDEIVYVVEFPNGNEGYLSEEQMRKISKERYFLEAL